MLTSPAILSWLLDPADPGPRHLALRDILGHAPEDSELLAARAAAHAAPPISAILDAMEPDGYWAKPGSGYSPKYRGTVWSIIALAQMGASAEADTRIAHACAYLLDHAMTPAGQFSTSIKVTPSGTVDCLQGNLLMSLLDLGTDDPRLDVALDWMARTVTGEGIAPAGDKTAPLRYYAYKSGPLFRCGVNAGLACGWGAAKVMLAFAKLPPARRTPQIEEAIRQGVEFLLSVDPATAAYPVGYGERPSGSWFKFGFPVFYVTDILQVVEALVALGFGDDPRLTHALEYVAGKADAEGRWLLEYDYTSKGWPGGEVRGKKRPNKWVTIRALRALKTSEVPADL